jgi:hypothetical protein
VHCVESLLAQKNSLIFCGGPQVYEQYLPICSEVIINYTKQPKKPAVKKYTSRVHKASLDPLTLTLCNGYYLNENSICENGSDEYYRLDEVFNTEAKALAQIYKELAAKQTKLENQLKTCKELQNTILIKAKQNK